jgi:uncharacterized protein
MAASIIDSTGFRMLPKLSPENRPFWTGGADGELLIQRCSQCGRWVHPPTGSCPACGGALRAEPVSGRGTVFAYTVNQYQFHPEVQPPNTIVIVQLDEQDDLRIPTDLVNASDDELYCGLPVQVLFERQGEIFYPLFEPVRSS